MPGRLAEKVALITGGAGGIGEATARLFVSEGASVAIADTDAEELDKARRAINASDCLASLVGDIAVECDASRLVTEVTERFGRLDVLVNNAATRAERNPITHIPTESWDQMLRTNLLGAVFCSKFAIPAMELAGGGSIIHVSSNFALRGRRGWAAYDASKAALLALTRDMACDHASQSIRVNAICPGPILTKFSVCNLARAEGISQSEAEGRLRSTGANCLLGRYGEPKEVAYAMLFLASDESSFMTGSVMNVDGGVPEAELIA